MKKTINIFTVVLTILLLSQSCKKKETEKSLADQFAGTYLVYDTLITTPISSSCGPDVTITSYLLVISKQDDNTVILDNSLICGNKALKLTSTTIAAATNGCATMSGTYSNGIFFINYAPYWNPGCSYNGTLKGYKQP